MSVDEWAARFKRSEEFPECLACGGTNTKEHAFTQVGGTHCGQHAGSTW
jgi:hypothetical protein